jgi:hypothetical protein
MFRKQGSTDHPVTFFMVSDLDGRTPKTGLTPTVTLSKDGGSFSPAAGTVSELGGGFYALAGNSTDRDTLGSLVAIAVASGAAAAPFQAGEVVPWDPFSASLAVDVAAITLKVGN